MLKTVENIRIIFKKSEIYFFIFKIFPKNLWPYTRKFSNIICTSEISNGRVLCLQNTSSRGEKMNGRKLSSRHYFCTFHIKAIFFISAIVQSQTYEASECCKSSPFGPKILEIFHFFVLLKNEDFEKEVPQFHEIHRLRSFVSRANDNYFDVVHLAKIACSIDTLKWILGNIQIRESHLFRKEMLISLFNSICMQVIYLDITSDSEIHAFLLESS